MGKQLNRIIDLLSDFLAVRKGFLPLVGVLLILINLVLQFIPAAGWLAEYDLLFHVGVIIAIFGIMVAWAL